MARALGLLGTLLLHLGLLLYLIWPNSETVSAVPPPPPYQEVQVTLLPEPSIQAEPGDGDGTGGEPDPLMCADKDPNYKGIGIIHNLGSMLIMSAPRQYPAGKAGAREGDMIVELYRLPGEDQMFLSVNRHGIILSWTIKMELICFREGK